MISSQVFDRLADEWMVVNPTQQDQHLELANRYGFDAWLKGFDASKRGARSNASYVEKAIVSNLPDEEQWTEQRYFSPWGTVIYSVNCESAQVRFWDDLELAVDFPAWVAKLKGRELSDNFVSMLWMRAKEAKRAASR